VRFININHFLHGIRAIFSINHI
jgi:hypothetical protein